MGQEELQDYCWSTWKGVGKDSNKAKGFYWVCIQERGMVYVDLLDAKGGAGYCGAGYDVIRQATHGKSKMWAREHPFETNELLARYFWGHFINGNPKKWHGHSEEENNIYQSKVNIIMNTCEKIRPLEVVAKN